MLLKGLNKNERQIIWRKLHPVDFDLLRCAMNQYRIYSNYGNEEFVLYAASHGYLELLQMGPITSIKPTAVYCAAYHGHIPVLQWVINNNRLHDNGRYSHFIGYAAGKGGQVHVIEWYCNFIGSEPFYEICDGAISGGKTKILDYLKKQGYILSKHLSACIIYGNVEIVKWLIANGITITENYIKLAAIHGKLDIIQYLFELGHIISFYMIRKIAEDYGHKNIVEYINAAKGPQ
jgi:hypothetical protein